MSRNRKNVIGVALALACCCAAFLLDSPQAVSAAKTTATSKNSLAGVFRSGSSEALVQAGPGEATNALQQNRENADLSAPVLKVTANMVLVDVVVTGNDGKPVTGLKADDFEILEDGTRQEVKSFSAMVALPPDAVRQPARVLPPGTYTNTPDIHPGEGPTVVLLIDALSTPFADQVYGEAELLRYLHAMTERQAGRQNMAIYELSHRLQLLQDFTADATLLDSALSRLRPTRPFDQLDDPTLTLSQVPVGPPPSNDPGQLLAEARHSVIEAEQTMGRFDRDFAITTTLEAFRNIARHAAAVPGRKELLWLSASFPLSFEVASQTPYARQMEETANLLTDAQVAVYPVDVRGLVAFDPLALQQGMSHLRDTFNAMNYMAGLTGGFAFYNRSDVDQGIAAAIDDGTAYYVLGYSPSNKNWNGKFRKIQVKLRTPGYHVRSRNGYFAMRKYASETQVGRSKRTRSELVRELEQNSSSAGTLPLFAQVVGPEKSHSQTWVNVQVDPRSVVFTPQANGYSQAEVHFITLVLDDKGKFITSKFDRLNVNASPATFAELKGTGLAIRQKLDLASGKYELRVGVRDVKSNLIGTLTAHVEIAPAQ